MALVIRLTRTGRRNYAQYRVVVAEEKNPRDGRFVEVLGSYNPHHEDENQKVQLDKDRIGYWLSQGGKPSQTVRSLFKKQGIVVG